MQISAANLLASQSQTVRPSVTATSFEPIAFKQTPASAVTQNDAAPKQAATSSGYGTAPVNAGAGARPSSGYVRPGTQIDIKI
jgi:hypothetical protein